MLGKNHALSGAAGYLAVGPAALPTATVTQHAIGTLVCAAWALAPDIDHPGATVSRKLGPAGRVASAGVNVLSGGHRQGSHSLVATAAVGAAAWWLTFHTSGTVGPAILAAVAIFLAVPILSKSFGAAVSGPVGAALGLATGWAIYSGTVAVGAWLFVAVTLGFALHWVGDALTPQGVPLLWPVSKWRARVPLFTTGSPVESVVSVGLVVAVAALGWSVFFRPAADAVASVWPWA